jgi:predicted DNA-binding transcriptional regulator AlpA
MALTINRAPKTITVQLKNKNSGHTKPAIPTISLDQPGRLRVAHLMSLLGVSHSTLYAGIKKSRYPKPDGLDGRMPYWLTTTVRNFLLTKASH